MNPSTTKTPRTDTTRKPSERYPEAKVEANRVDFANPQACAACGETMRDSGMSEDSEYVDVRAKEFIVVQQKRAKHRCCKCHGSIVTAPLPPRVTPGGSYSDDVIIDATLSKYCDLIPMERYCNMAARGGFPGLPPQSLIQASMVFAEFLRCVYERIVTEVLSSRVVRADETPHRMLEGDEKKRWFLWSFSVRTACFFECHDTRSGDVSTSVLNQSLCEVLLTDVYSGYGKSIRAVNALRSIAGWPLLKAAYCNAHARREFMTGDNNPDAKWMVARYQEIYRLEATSGDVSEKRRAMRPIFETMHAEAKAKLPGYSSKNQLSRGYSYFLNNYDGLTTFLDDLDVPIDNNASERLLRSPAIGRKTWYGTHSKDGAETAAIHFTIVETCKLNGVNPRAYFRDIVETIHRKGEILTPSHYKARESTNTC